MGTLVGEQLCSGKAYATASSCDDRDFSIKLAYGF
jgi:hypothetical protein